MGEQRPLEMLNTFISTAIEPNDLAPGGYYSRPDKISSGSLESRRYLAPRHVVDGVERHAQTEFYEYHWSHLMQGNRLDDLAPMLKRLMLQRPWRLPVGLRVIWVLFWALVLLTAWAFWRGPLSDVGLLDAGIDTAVRALVGTGLVAMGLLYLVTRVLPRSLTRNFVDVVRYLDTSPRSYEVRHDIRSGVTEFMAALHRSGQYDRIIVVGHGLGSFIAYDGISSLWSRYNKLHKGAVAEGAANDPAGDGPVLAGLAGVEAAAAQLDLDPSDESRRKFRASQRDLWIGQRQQGNPWLITDLVTIGSPMYLADHLVTADRKTFDARVSRWELPTCPPQDEGAEYNDVHRTGRWFSWNNKGRRVLYHGAPFAVTRWTNVWFPARAGIFGDWLGGPLAPLFGDGIADIEISGNRPASLVPARPQSKYFAYPDDTTPGSVTTTIRNSLDLAATDWVPPRSTVPAFDRSTR